MRSSAVKAITIALALTVVAGVANRWIRESRAASASVFTPLAESLDSIPKRIGTYTGRDVPLQDDVLRAARVDSFLHRDYLDPKTGRHLVAYVGYWGRQNVGMGHGPEVCYPASGWSVDAPARKQTLTFSSGPESKNATIARHRFVQTEPEGVSRRAVGFVAVVGGDFRASSMGYFWHRPSSGTQGAGHYLAQVHISASAGSGSWEDAEKDILDFMRLFLPVLTKSLPHSRSE